MDSVQFNRTSLVGKEISYVREALSSGQWVGDGPFGQSCERLLEEETGAARVLLTPSCTHMRRNCPHCFLESSKEMRAYSRCLRL